MQTNSTSEDESQELQLTPGETLCILILSLIFACGIPVAVLYFALTPK